MKKRPKRNLEICKMCDRLRVYDSELYGTGYLCIHGYTFTPFFGEDEWSKRTVPHNCNYYMEHELGEWNNESDKKTDNKEDEDLQSMR